MLLVGRETPAERPVAMPDQVAKITAAMDAEYRAMVLLAAYGSLRFGELAGLRRNRIDVLHRVIQVEESAVELADGRVIFGPPKSAAGRRTVAIPADLMAVIEGHLNDHVAPEPNALLFTSPEGHPLRRSKWRHRWESACEGAEVSGLRFHDLRGSGATWAATTGATVRELMSRLGHATPAMALRYQHATIDRDQAIADRLGALMQAVNQQPVEDAAEVRAIGK
jgi:integrase